MKARIAGTGAVARTILLLLLLAFCPASSSRAAEYRFPDDAGIIDVKRDFGARGDGVADDTAALKKAIQTALRGDGFRNPRMIYLPAGTYVVSEPLKARVTDGPEDGSQWCNGWRCGLFLAGESRERTVVKLKDQCPGFGDPAKPQAMIVTGSTGHGDPHDKRQGGWGNEGFQNTLMNFSVDTGRRNPGAMGVDFLASNRGTMEEITVRSGDGAGVCGVDLSRAWPGPALVKNVAVDGFDYGLRQDGMDCSMTYEHLVLTNQKVCAIRGTQQPFMSLRGVTSRNAVPVFVIDGGSAFVNILDSSFTHIGRMPAPPAIISECYLVLKHVAVDGYPVVVAAPNRKEAVAPAVDLTARAGKGEVAFFTSRAPTRATPGPDSVPDLPVKETPTFHHTDFAKWANPARFAKGSRTAGIQEAIDSGAEIVYLPNGSYHVGETVVLRGRLRKVMGMEARLSFAQGVDPAIRFDGADGGCVVLEHLSVGGDIEHNCAQKLSVRKCNGGYRNSIRGTGEVFLEDGMFDHPRILYPQRLWARQLNSEFGDRPNFTNRGGTAWILGMKVEGWVSGILNVGGVIECYALYAMTGNERTEGTPFTENREGWLAVSFRDGGQGNHFTKLKDTWDGTTKQIDNWHREYCLVLGGRQPTSAASTPNAPGPLRATAVAADKVRLEWGAAAAADIPVTHCRIARDGKPVAGVPAGTGSYTDTGCAEKTRYRYDVTAVDERGASSAATKVSVSTPADDVAPKVVAAGAWPGDAACVTIDFDEPLDAASARQPRNYVFAPKASVTEARLNASGDRVILRLAAPLADGLKCSIAFKGVKDRSKAGNPVAAPAEFAAWYQGEGLRLEFWNAKDSFEGKPVATRVDRRIDYWWGNDSPAEGVVPGAFSARWSGVLRPKVGGEYVFNTGVVTGCRIILDGKIVHDVWGGGNEWTWSRQIPLEGGRRYDFVFETHAVAGSAGARLKWKGPGMGDSQFVTDEFLFLKPPKR